jgi:hypothetical protein
MDDAQVGRFLTVDPNRRTPLIVVSEEAIACQFAGRELKFGCLTYDKLWFSAGTPRCRDETVQGPSTEAAEFRRVRQTRWVERTRLAKFLGQRADEYGTHGLTHSG